uniref:Uncharacterized protein n=1 Tax=Arundo donax TaxID=35708 RepID=A0A0A9AVA6_ARUDO
MRCNLQTQLYSTGQVPNGHKRTPNVAHFMDMHYHHQYNQSTNAEQS